MDKKTAKLFLEVLKDCFPWLGTNEDANGADTIQELASLYYQLETITNE